MAFIIRLVPLERFIVIVRGVIIIRLIYFSFILKLPCIRTFGLAMDYIRLTLILLTIWLCILIFSASYVRFRRKRFYTLFASLPLLIIIIFLVKIMYLRRFVSLSLTTQLMFQKSVFFRLICSFAFIVKFPMYFVHL